MNEPLKSQGVADLLCPICKEYTSHKRFNTRSGLLSLAHCTVCGFRHIIDQSDWKGASDDIMQTLR